MNCVRCGKPIPEGEMFCEACASSPLPSTQKVSSATGTIPTARRVAPRPQKRRGRGGLIVLLILMILITGASLYFSWRMYRSVHLQQASIRVQEANLADRELAISSQQQKLSDVQSQLDKALETENALRAQVAELQAQIKGSESSMNQNQYDLDTALKKLDELQADLDEAQAEALTLTEERDQVQEDLETLQKSFDELKEKFDAQSEKMDWIDAYVVYVENDGTDYYHSFECPRFKRQSFWVYNKKLAESKGYTPCPDCGG